ncbi:MAG: SxtJ family membrane protein [Planctomycetota bacterium]
MIKLDLKPEERIVRQFAFFAVLGLPLLAWFVLRLVTTFEWAHPVFLAAAAVGVSQLGLYLIGVRVLSRALFLGLSILFVPIGFVISHVLIALVYYLVLTPIALVFRLMGRDVIGKKLDPNTKSYWHERSGDRPASSYFKLY